MTGIILVGLCVLIGLLTYGLGLLLLLPLAPALIRLFRAPGEYDSVERGCLGLIAAVGGALLIAVSFAITFLAVCFPVGYIGIQNATNPFSGTVALVLAVAIGSLAAGFVAWLLVRRFWPRGGRR